MLGTDESNFGLARDSIDYGVSSFLAFKASLNEIPPTHEEQTRVGRPVVKVSETPV
jgi:hypothetical protein